jgi:hypothetical protein
MKKIVFLLSVLAIYSVNGFAQQETVASCFESYKGQLAKGHNALAMAIDNGFFVCGFAFGSYSKESASKKSLNECEVNRIDPANEVQGVRKIMTHCRIYQTQLLE